MPYSNGPDKPSAGSIKALARKGIPQNTSNGLSI
jgi:hypothetical protein